MVIYYKNVMIGFTLKNPLYKALIEKLWADFYKESDPQILLNIKLIIVFIAKLLIFG